MIGRVLLALMMSNAGGAWDNAKNHIERGHLGGKGSEAHKACVVGNSVGDPLKDTSGPSMNILIHVMALVSLVIAPLLAAHPLWVQPTAHPEHMMTGEQPAAPVESTARRD